MQELLLVKGRVVGGANDDWPCEAPGPAARKTTQLESSARIPVDLRFRGLLDLLELQHDVRALRNAARGVDGRVEVLVEEDDVGGRGQRQDQVDESQDLLVRPPEDLRVRVPLQEL